MARFDVVWWDDPTNTAITSHRGYPAALKAARALATRNRRRTVIVDTQFAQKGPTPHYLFAQRIIEPNEPTKRVRRKRSSLAAMFQ